MYVVLYCIFVLMMLINFLDLELEIIKAHLYSAMCGKVASDSEHYLNVKYLKKSEVVYYAKPYSQIFYR